MNTRTAISVIKENFRLFEKNTRLLTALAVVINAANKDIAKIPDGGSWNKYYKMYDLGKCPKCGCFTGLISGDDGYGPKITKHKYCPNCGQRILQGKKRWITRDCKDCFFSYENGESLLCNADGMAVRADDPCEYFTENKEERDDGTN